MSKIIDFRVRAVNINMLKSKTTQDMISDGDPYLNYLLLHLNPLAIDGCREGTWHKQGSHWTLAGTSF